MVATAENGAKPKGIAESDIYKLGTRWKRWISNPWTKRCDSCLDARQQSMTLGADGELYLP